MPQRKNFAKSSTPRTSMLDDEPTLKKETKIEQSKPVSETPKINNLEQSPVEPEIKKEETLNVKPQNIVNNPEPELKTLEPGKTLIAINQPKIDGHLTTLKIYYGNFIKPLMKDANGNWEFKRLNEKEYRKRLADFLDSPEGSEYKVPTEEEIEAVNKEVLEKEKAYLKKLEASKKSKEVVKPSQVQETSENEDTSKLDKGKQPLPTNPFGKLGKIETDVKPTDLRYVDDTLSYTEEQMEKYRKRGFTQPQLEQIEKGLKNEVDVTQYAFKDMSPGQMERQRKILQERQGLHNEAEDRFGQDYSDEKAETLEDKLEKLEEKEYSGVKVLGNTMLIIILSLLAVALCVVLVTILIKAFKIYSNGL